jgi:hypothetical protein
MSNELSFFPETVRKKNADDLFGFVALGVGGFGACWASLCERKEGSIAESEVWAIIQVAPHCAPNLDRATGWPASRRSIGFCQSGGRFRGGVQYSNGSGVLRYGRLQVWGQFEGTSLIGAKLMGKIKQSVDAIAILR